MLPKLKSQPLLVNHGTAFVRGYCVGWLVLIQKIMGVEDVS